MCGRGAWCRPELLVPDRKCTITEPDQQRHHPSSSWIPTRLHQSRTTVDGGLTKSWPLRNNTVLGPVWVRARIQEYRGDVTTKVGKTVYSRVGDPVFTVLQQGTQQDRYRACLSRLGMDDGRCETYLNNEVPSRGGGDRCTFILTSVGQPIDGKRYEVTHWHNGMAYVQACVVPSLKRKVVSSQQQDCGHGTVEHFVHKIRYDTCVCVS